MMNSTSAREGRSLGNSMRSLDTRRFRLKAVNNEVKLYEKYFHKVLAKRVTYVQIGLSFFVVAIQVIVMGLLYGPTEVSDLSTKTAGIWPSIITLLACGLTLWATRKPTYCKLHGAMALHIVSFITHFNMEYFLLEYPIPSYQMRIYQFQNIIRPIDDQLPKMNFFPTSPRQVEGINETEETRAVWCLTLSVIVALAGILQMSMSLLMGLKTGRAICSGRTQLEGRCVQLEAVHRGIDVDFQEIERRIGNNQSNENNNEDKENLDDLNADDIQNKLERSDALPPPPYESGYFHPSLLSSP